MLKLSVSVLNDEEHTSSCFTVKSAKSLKRYADWVHRVNRTLCLLGPLREKKFTFEMREEKVEMTIEQFAKIHGFLYLDNVRIARHKPMKLKRACSRLLYLWAALVRNGWTCKSLKNALEDKNRNIEAGKLHFGKRKKDKANKIVVKKQHKAGVFETACTRELESKIESLERQGRSLDFDPSDLRQRLKVMMATKQDAVSKLREFALRLKPAIPPFSRAVMHCAYFSAKNREGMNDSWGIERLRPNKSDEKVVDRQSMQKWKWCFHRIEHSIARLGKAKDLLHPNFWKQVISISEINTKMWNYCINVEQYLSKEKMKMKVKDDSLNINFLLKNRTRKNDFHRKFLDD